MVMLTMKLLPIQLQLQVRLILLLTLIVLLHAVISNSLNIPVLYESPRLLIINKPSGIQHHDEIVHRQQSDDETGDDEDGIVEVDFAEKTGAVRVPGIMTAVREGLVQHSDGGQQNQSQQRLWGVHRLDRVTTGILVLAKDQEMASRLSNAFRRGDIQKLYVGLSDQKPKKKKQGWVKGGMERSRNKTWKLVDTTTNNKNKNKTKTPKNMTGEDKGQQHHRNYAKTRFFTSRIQLLRKNKASDRSDRSEEEEEINSNNTNHVSATVILFKPITGRTHQLRVAAKAMGIPLSGDPIYKSSSSSSSKSSTSADKSMVATATSTGLESLLVEKRTLLHASGIHIPKLVDDQDEVNIWCPPPFFEYGGGSGGYSDDDSHHESSSSSSIDNDSIFQSSVHKLMGKHCDVPEILEAMRSHSSSIKNS